MERETEEKRKPYFAYSASLRIMDAKELHEEITQRTGLSASHCHRAGEIANVKSGRKWDNDIWILDSPLGKDEQLSAHLRWLWAAIEPHKTYFQQLVSRGVKMDVFCGYTSDSDGAGFGVEHDALEIISELHVPLEVSVMLGRP